MKANNRGRCVYKKESNELNDIFSVVNGIESMGVGFSKKRKHESVNNASPDSSPPPKLTYKQPRTKHPLPPPQFPQLPKPIQNLHKGPILGKPYVDINTMYEIKRELGRGTFGITYLCVEKATGREYACKSIPREKMDNNPTEVMILQHLSGQHNIVELKAAYEDRKKVHLVMELCSGGELFHRIVAKGKYSEREAATIMRQILNVVHVCHFMGVMHRDIRPENFLFATNQQNAALKLADFGSSVFIHQGKVYKDIVGNEYFVAPEVLKRSYGKEIDVWNAGVILYTLLSGVTPFSADTDKGMVDATLRGKLDMDSEPWPSISDAAKDLVRKMLTYDPKERITASGALEYPWLKEAAEASDKSPESAVLIRMKQFKTMNNMKKLALKVIAESLSEEESKGLKHMFNNMDTDRSGAITFEELKSGLSTLGSPLSESEIRQLMDAADINKNGTIDYCEFITATMDRYKLEKEGNLFEAFQYFDKDNNGYVTRDELRQAITEYQMGNEAAIDEILEDVDPDIDGRISYQDFVTMMRSKC